MATGVVGLLGLLCLILFFTVGQPFGTLNDACIGITALLSGLLAWLLYSRPQAQAPLLSKIALLAALVGGLIAAVGSVLVMFNVVGWFLAGLYMAAGNGLIGLWLLYLIDSAGQTTGLPQSMATFGMVAGVTLALGLAAVPGILGRIDAWDVAPWYVSYVGQASALGYLVLYPVWCILLGRMMPLQL